METSNRIAPDVSLGRSVKIFGFANLYGCTVGDESRIGYFVEIQKNATVSRCALQNFEPLVYLRRRHYRGRRIYWSSRVLHQRSVSACVPAGRNFANGRRVEGDSHCGQTTRDDWVGGGHPGRNHDRCRSHRWCRGSCDQERRPAHRCRRESRPPPTQVGRKGGAVRFRVSLKSSDRFTQWWPEAERDFLAARIGPLGKARWQRHEWQ
jgi:hypothetical protein